jgi:hypothetical protein
VRLGERTRTAVLAIVGAIALGFAVGWCGRAVTTPTPGSRARNVLEVIRERVREFTVR